jgi:antitoxin (DNA-binding transcriptional repressor) of toxin-antitoxin stability system
VRDTGRPLLVTEGGVPVVRLTPPPFSKRERRLESFGCMAHTILRAQEDLIEPLGLPVWEEFG